MTNNLSIIEIAKSKKSLKYFLQRLSTKDAIELIKEYLVLPHSDPFHVALYKCYTDNPKIYAKFTNILYENISEILPSYNG